VPLYNDEGDIGERLPLQDCCAGIETDARISFLSERPPTFEVLRSTHPVIAFDAGLQRTMS
jgi:hypothetical protein